MTIEPRLDIVGSALADPTRSRILCELMDGRAFTNKELSCAANVTAQTASAHLKHLEGAGLTASIRSGRHIYHRIANQEVAEVLEVLALLSPTDHLTRAKRCRNVETDALIARSCYNHIAGRLGVLISENLISENILILQDGLLKISHERQNFFEEIGIELPKISSSNQPFVRCCLDWTERRNHISGPLGILIMHKSLDAGWLKRQTGTRALLLSSEGHQVFEKYFGINRQLLAEIE